MRSSGEWTNRPIFRSERLEHGDVSPRVYLSHRQYMNGTDSRGREEKRRRINERHRKARLRETSEEREARLAR